MHFFDREKFGCWICDSCISRLNYRDDGERNAASIATKNQIEMDVN